MVVVVVVVLLLMLFCSPECDTRTGDVGGWVGGGGSIGLCNCTLTNALCIW